MQLSRAHPKSIRNHSPCKSHHSDREYTPNPPYRPPSIVSEDRRAMASHDLINSIKYHRSTAIAFRPNLWNRCHLAIPWPTACHDRVTWPPLIHRRTDETRREVSLQANFMQSKASHCWRVLSHCLCSGIDWGIHRTTSKFCGNKTREVYGTKKFGCRFRSRYHVGMLMGDS